jgi:hypothetical protein
LSLGRALSLLAVCLAAIALAGVAAAARPRLASADRTAIRAVLEQYVPAMLERKDVRLGWRLSGPQVRGSSTLAEWLHGGVPIYPFPARPGPVDGWTLTYVTPGDVGLDLLLQPRKGAKSPAIAFRIEMTRIGGAWKVNAFYPEATFDTGGAKVFSPQDATGNGATAQVPRPRVSGRWLLLPAAVVGALAVVGVPAGLLVSRRRARSASRDYLARNSR